MLDALALPVLSDVPGLDEECIDNRGEATAGSGGKWNAMVWPVSLPPFSSVGGCTHVCSVYR
jgi:hypothetical protein